MKKILIFLVLLDASNTVFAVNDTTWLNYKLDKIIKPLAEYYSLTGTKKQYSFPISIYNKSTNVLYSKGYLEDTVGFIKDGAFSFYGGDTNVVLSGEYSENMKDGKWVEYTTAGSVFRKSRYNAGKRVGADTMYYESGAIRRIDIYETDIAKSGTCYDSLGHAIKYIPYETMPYFKGNFMKFVANKFEYPASAKDDRVMGEVIVRFIVDINGQIKNLKVVQTVREDLDNEAIRVIMLSQPWVPGKKEGIVVDMYTVRPLSFLLE